MPRNISFMLTQEQFRNRTKTVTRRVGWKFLKPGDVLNGCEKCQGLGPGGKIVKLGQIIVLSVRREPLGFMCTELDVQPLRHDQMQVAGVEHPDDYGYTEAALEGFPDMTGSEFVEMFCEHMGVDPWSEITRIGFDYINAGKSSGV